MLPIRDNIPSRQFPIMVVSIVFANFVIFFNELSLSHVALEDFLKVNAVVPERFMHANWSRMSSYYPLITHQFLHGGVLHLVSNMWTLWIFGDNVEDVMGRVRFGLFYLFCGIIAAAFQI